MLEALAAKLAWVSPAALLVIGIYGYGQLNQNVESMADYQSRQFDRIETRLNNIQDQLNGRK